MNRQKFLSKSEIEYLYESLKAAPERDRLLIRVLLETGGRISEILNIKKQDLNLESGSILIRGLKGSNDREIPIKKSLKDALRAFISGTACEGVFEINYNQAVYIWNWYRPKKVGLHSLRHSFAINLLEKSQKVNLVKTALGHKSLNSSLIYLDFISSQDELRKALK